MDKKYDYFYNGIKQFMPRPKDTKNYSNCAIIGKINVWLTIGFCQAWIGQYFMTNSPTYPDTVFIFNYVKLNNLSNKSS